MARLSKADRAAVVNEYLNATGQNAFEPEMFLNWLKRKPDHPAYARFFDKTDKEAALAWRVSEVRRFVSDLRINVEVRVFDVPTTVSVPRFITSGEQKSKYHAADTDDPEDRASELGRAVEYLRGWHGRYAGLAVLHGCPIDAEIGAAIARLDTALTG